jgi:hypothetical protein
MVQNNDIQVRITLKDEDGVAFTISALNALEFYAYRLDNNQKVLIATYKKSNTGVYGITTITDGSGIVEIILNREKTRNLPNGIVYLETRIQLSASSEFISSLQNLGVNGTQIDTTTTSANPNSLT